MHALAQLPDSVGLELASAADDTLLSSIIDAYGLRKRARLGSGAQISTGAFVTPEGLVGVDALLPATFAELVELVGGGAASAIDASRDRILTGERVVIVTNYPAHYRLPLFKGIADRLATVGARFSVLFLASGERSRPWLTGPPPQFEHEFLPSVRLPIRRRAALIPKGLEARLRAYRPTILLVAGFSPFVAHRTSRIARELGAALGVWSGETPLMPTAQSRARRGVRLQVVGQADFGIAYGLQAATYLRSLSADLPIVVGRNTAPISLEASQDRGRRDSPFTFVLIGDLASPRKGADVAIEAMRLIPDEGIRLRVIGGGRLLGVLAERAAADHRIEFLGALTPEEVSRQLSEGDALLFPTRSDVFGLALVEAMGAALVPVVSAAAAAVDDLAVDHVNAIVLHGHDPSEWASAIKRLAADPENARGLGQRARRTVEARWTIDHAVEAMVAGLRLGAGCEG